MQPNQDHGKELINLLSWKRHEQPPPGYFSDFSDQIIKRLESGETNSPASFWQALVEMLETKPVLAGAYSVGLCSMLLMGISASQALLQTTVGASDTYLTSPISPDLVFTEFSNSRKGAYTVSYPSSMTPVFPPERLRIGYPENPARLKQAQFQLLEY